jgi:chemotaxis protein methyltransferase CheR
MSTTPESSTRSGLRPPSRPVAPAVPPLRPAAAPRAGVDEYVVFCEGVRALTGLDLSQYKRGQMERRVLTFIQRQGASSLSDYLVVLRKDAEELDRFLDRVTINVSQLWRNPEQWEALGHDVIPQLAQARRIRVWSAGCSYGAECYTIAAVCQEYAPEARVEVKGTDIDPRMLARARAGVFSKDDVRTVPAASLERWFDSAEDGWRAKPALARTISFDQADLLAMRVPPQAYDLVLCRNVVIYFNEEVRDQLHARLASSLRSGGFLVIGSTERVSGPEELGLTLTRPFTYRKA